MAISIIRMHPDLIEVIWDKVEPLLIKAEKQLPEYEQVDVKYFKEPIANGKWILLVAVSGPDVLGAGILKRDRNVIDAIEVSSIGGSRMAEWFDDMIKEIKRVTLESNCKYFIGYSDRKGWVKYMEKCDAIVAEQDGMSSYTVEVKNG